MKQVKLGRIYKGDQFKTSLTNRDGKVIGHTAESVVTIINGEERKVSPDILVMVPDDLQIEDQPD